MPNKKDYTVVKCEPVYSGVRTTKKGKPVRNGTFVTYKDGRQEILLTPAGTGAKFASELKNKVHITNDGVVERGKNGKPKRLTDLDAEYRRGWLDCQEASAKAYNAKHSK